MFEKKANINKLICSYIQKCLLVVIQTPKTTICNAKLTPNTKNTFPQIQLVFKSICRKRGRRRRRRGIHSNHRFLLILWPAFGGLEILVYIYNNIYIYEYFMLHAVRVRQYVPQHARVQDHVDVQREIRFRGDSADAVGYPSPRI